jgi:EAL domain-containing protein (putative c-di-GMP-specific phosphodiesterase class I)
LRWDHPGRGLLVPRDFFLDEDDSALLVRIGWSVVIEAVRRAAHWRLTFPSRPVTVSVNLSPGHLERRDLAARVEHLLVDNEVPGGRALAFEVGERHFLSPRLRARDRLIALRNLEVDIVVDDFGATAAATDVDADELCDSAIELLESLARSPLDVVKLDPRFVARLVTDARISRVVDAAHAADIRVVALAVENDQDARRARETGCDLAQGFHYFHPERPTFVDRLLADR